MNPWSILFAFIAAIGFIKAESLPPDQVEPYKQPAAVTITERSAVSFKPCLHIDTGCRPYAAVDPAGRTNIGHTLFLGMQEGCETPPKGTQIYGRSKWHKQLWGNMYAWYFPKDQTSVMDRQYNNSHPHEWTSVIVWLDNPAISSPKIIALATSWFVTHYKKYYPPPADVIAGNTTKIEYRQDYQNNFLHNVDVTSSDGGEFQELILWEQLTPQSQRALSTTDFGPLNSVPFIDANFDKNLEMAYPLK